MTQQTAGQGASQRSPAQIDEYIMSLPFSDDQKAQISQIGQSMKSRMDIVAQDDEETADQKQAMTEGLQRMRLRQIFMVLTHEQRLELRAKLAPKASVAPGQGTMLHQGPAEVTSRMRSPQLQDTKSAILGMRHLRASLYQHIFARQAPH